MAPLARPPVSRLGSPVWWFWTLPLHALIAFSGSAFLLSVLAFFGGMWWPLDLLTHFQVLYLPAFVAGLIAALLMRRRWRVLLAALGLAIVVARMAPLYLDAPAPPIDAIGPRLRLMSFNVLANNDTPDQVIRYLRESDEDLVFVIETEVMWDALLTEQATGYQVVMRETRNGAFGMIVLSRIPLISVTPIYFDRPNVVSAHVRLAFDGMVVSILATHPPPPARGEGASNRDKQFHHIAHWTSQQHEPVIVIGDMNATAWSVPYRKMLDATDLVDSENGFGYQPTWPSFPVSVIPIDRCMHSGELTTTERFIGEACGSDHRPLHIRLARPKE